MNLKKVLKNATAHGAVAVVLGGAALGTGAVTANADPDWGPRDHDEWVDDWQYDRDWKWNRWNDHDWDKWWKVNKWRNDDRPPWGWGRPPAVQWRGHPPQWIDYWGYRVHPVWDPGFKAFGFWLFGVFIPVIVV
ncbi:hypothetical protein [Mycobacterium sp. IS-3022]|uniref:hypothetical protein n=1 Tax=Mycobacterium sp. IS-3022 TaxID=1772277 RepID=UPI00074166F7|nr:hypothetical protein [Mycobacterium sp. IS-3022]KUI00149.1 hypothetical protein AU188_04485 [Mycobacterium sp. IS-3022]